MASDPRMLELDAHDKTWVEVNPKCLQVSKDADEENGHEGYPCSYLQTRINTQVSSFVFTIVDTSLTSQGVGPSRIQERVILPLDDGSDRSQNVSWDTEDADNLRLLPPQHWKPSTHYADGDSLNCNSEESTHVVVDHENSTEMNEMFGT